MSGPSAGRSPIVARLTTNREAEFTGEHPGLGVEVRAAWIVLEHVTRRIDAIGCVSERLSHEGAPGRTELGAGALEARDGITSAGNRGFFRARQRHPRRDLDARVIATLVRRGLQGIVERDAVSRT